MSRKWRDCFPALAPSMSLVIPLITAKKFRSRICQVNSYERQRQSLISHLSPKRKELKVSWHIWGHRGIVVAVPFLAFAFLWLTIRWAMNHAIRPAGVSKIPKREERHCRTLPSPYQKKIVLPGAVSHVLGIQEEAIPLSTRSFILFTLFSLIHVCQTV